MRDQIRRHGPGAQGGRPDERAVRDQGRRDLRARGQPARVAHRALRLARRPACRWPRSRRAAWPGSRWTSRALTREIVPPATSRSRKRCSRSSSSRASTRMLGPEMKSTGEVMGVGRTFGEAFAQGATRVAVCCLPTHGPRAAVRCATRDKAACGRGRAATWPSSGFEIVATRGTAAAIAEAGVAVQRGQQGQGRPAAHRRHDQERRDRSDRQHHRGQAGDRRLASIRRAALQHKVSYTRRSPVPRPRSWPCCSPTN